MDWFKIPVLSVQDTLLSVDKVPATIALKCWCESNCEDGWNVGYQLGRRWYPVFNFEREWDATNFMIYLTELELLGKR